MPAPSWQIVKTSEDLFENWYNPFRVETPDLNLALRVKKNLMKR